MNEHTVIVGTGLAGYTTARELRRLAPDQRLSLVTADDGSAYSKPMLSTAYRKGQGPGDLVQASAEDMAENLDADILTGLDVEAIEPDTGRLILDDGHLEYDRLVLALGANPLPPPVRGSAADRVLQVNSLADYRLFREAARDARRVLIIGGGLIGCEFANDLIEGGYQVDVVFPEPHPLPQLLPEPPGRALATALERLGARLFSGRTVESVDGDGERLRVRLSDDTVRQADLVLSAVGLAPRTALAESAGLAVDRGIRVDRYLRSSDSRIHALGDCAEVEGHLLCYVAPLTAAARALARTLAGEETAVHYPVMPVTVKTSCCRVVAWPPAPGTEGEWRHDGEGSDLRGEYRTAEGRLAGFYLTGSRLRERMAMAEAMPPLID